MSHDGLEHSAAHLQPGPMLDAQSGTRWGLHLGAAQRDDHLLDVHHWRLEGGGLALVARGQERRYRQNRRQEGSPLRGAQLDVTLHAYGVSWVRWWISDWEGRVSDQEPAPCCSGLMGKRGL